MPADPCDERRDEGWVEDLQNELAQTSAALATATVEREAARADVEAERAHAEQRISDMRSNFEEQVTQLRRERDAAATAAREEGRRADRAEAQAQTTTGHDKPTGDAKARPPRKKP
jgi:colicin import membrane protein